ncbi:helix-turn-helix domain-containing protein, partial [Anaerorhabdus sp.]
MNKIGNFLSELRKEKGFTQQEVADVLNVSNKTVSKWERSEGYPEIETLIDLAGLYNISVDELLAGERTKAKCMDSLEELLTLDFEKKKIYSLFISFIALLIFFSIYFYTKDFSLSFFIYLALMCLSFMFLMLGLLKLKKYHIKKKFIYFEWIRNFICLS